MNALSGTWKVDMKQVNWSKKPDVYLLSGGMYECKTCVPAIKVKADGSDQPITGHPYFDTMTIQVVDDHTIKEIDKKNGKVVGESSTTVSSDGNTMNFEFTDSSNTNGGPPVTGKGSETRVAKGPAGSHAVSGSWRMAEMGDLSDNASAYTFAFKGDELTMTNPTGQTYTAKLDGTDAPMKGDPGVTSVSVKMLGKSTLEEIYKRDGKPISVVKTTADPDGKTVHVVVTDKLHNTTTEFKAVRQQ
jgi:hypothetical protein